MLYRKLGQTDMQVSVIAVGYWAVADEHFWGAQDDQDALKAVHAALDTGINFFDTAEGYGGGTSEEMLGKALADRRDEAIIATKVSPSRLRRDDLIRACENSLRRLNTGHIDLYQVHWPNWDIPLDETFAALETLQHQGKIRAVGVSNFGSRDLRDLVATGRAESNQVAYNLLFRAIEDDILPFCREQEIGILCYSPLMQGLLTGKFATPDNVPDERARTRHFPSDRPMARHNEPGAQDEVFAAVDAMRRLSRESGLSMVRLALGWLLAQPGVTSVIAGARNAAQARANAAAGAVPLDPSIVAELTRITEDIRQKLGPNADMWEAGTAARMR